MHWIVALLSLGLLQTPAFEVASVKPSAPDTPRGGFGMSPGGLFQVTGISLAELLQAAYSQGLPFHRFQLAGGPDWLEDRGSRRNAGRPDLPAQVDEQSGSPGPKMRKSSLTC